MQWAFHKKAAAYLQAPAIRGSVLADGPAGHDGCLFSASASRTAALVKRRLARLRAPPPAAVAVSLALGELSFELAAQHHEFIHAEAYPTGELKHGPLALVKEAMPVFTAAPNDSLIEKLKSNLQEVRARAAASCSSSPTPIRTSAQEKACT